MFARCTSLEKLELGKFKTNEESNMINMFLNCSNELKLKIKKKYKNLKKEAFEE